MYLSLIFLHTNAYNTVTINDVGSMSDLIYGILSTPLLVSIAMIVRLTIAKRE